MFRRCSSRPHCRPGAHYWPRAESPLRCPRQLCRQSWGFLKKAKSRLVTVSWADRPSAFDVADKLLRLAHERRERSRKKRDFVLDPALAISTGLSTESYARLLRMAGFVARIPRTAGGWWVRPAAASVMELATVWPAQR
jgi:hypothetical protein